MQAGGANRKLRLLIAELVNTGSELMLGRVLNTHQQWLCRQLSDIGYAVARQVAVPDTGRDIEQAVREALARADLVITTGGLGPTSDDITRDLIARMLDRTLREDAATLTQIENYFASRNRPIPPRTRVQALVPEGAFVLPNPHGTAPGLAMELRSNRFRVGEQGSWLVMLPGPPRELRPMFIESVVPLLRRVLPPQSQFVCSTLRTTGIGESAVQEIVCGPLQTLVNSGLELGYCARMGQVDVRLSARGHGAIQVVSDAEALVRKHLDQHIYGRNEDELEQVVVALLAQRKQTLAVAESCTGGCIAHRVTNIPGASAVFLAGLVTYSNAAKHQFLGVLPETLAQHGAVSEAVAREMAEGARQRTGATFALSSTGIAGPSGGTAAKPVGTVFTGLAGPFGTAVEHHVNPCDRETFKQVVTLRALEMLRQRLL